MPAPLRLTIAVRSHGHTKALKDGTVTMNGIEFEFIEVEPQIAAFRRMVREVEFDVCELAPTTYFIAKGYGAVYTALPIFFERRFHHAGLVTRPDAGISGPKDLEGKKVGVRAYSVTTGVWTRGILVNEFGLDSDKVTWVVDDEEHVPQLTLPSNVIHAPNGRSLAEMMADGDLQAGFLANAGIGRAGPPTANWNAGSGVPPVDKYDELFPNADELGAEWYRRTGIYPMHSTLVIKDSILKAHPEVAPEIYRAFVKAKEIYLDRLRKGDTSGKDDQKRIDLMKVVGDDPLPYGIKINQPAIDALRLYAAQQHLTPKHLTTDELFIDADKF
jgi:4,5-dihydroxyphthalate decarboxylase